VAARSTCSSSATTATARGWSAWPAPTTTSTRTNGCRAQLAAQLVGVRRRRYASADAERHRAVDLTFYSGHGYYSDPYKPLDTRPSTRDTVAWLTRYNHYFVDADATLKVGYRLLFESFGGTSNTFDAAWAQALPWGLVVTPALRFYTQTSARLLHESAVPRAASSRARTTVRTRGSHRSAPSPPARWCPRRYGMAGTFRFAPITIGRIPTGRCSAAEARASRRSRPAGSRSISARIFRRRHTARNVR